MLGAIAGDMIGSAYENRPIKTTEFPLFSDNSRFTDDSVLTTAVAFAIMTDRDYGAALRIFGRLYPLAGYGGNFANWLVTDDPAPYNSWGNGSAMRVSPVGHAFAGPEEVLAEAERSAVMTHDHPEGIKGAQAIALAVHLARNGAGKAGIKSALTERFGYDLDRSLDDIRPRYLPDMSCQGSVPEAIIAFLEGDDFEETVRLAVSLGGDSDTQACIAGSIAHAHFGEIPRVIVKEVRSRLPKDLLQIIDEFCEKFPV
ncbi:MAG: ADP-ribosylglycohydrolase family protein [bacterium]